jgi:hypothetical protein
MTRAPQPAQPPARRMRGFEPAAGLVSDRIRAAGEKRGFAVTRLLTHWPDIAGEDLGTITRPVRIGYSRDGFGATLTLLVAPAQAPMVQMQLPRLREKINACYGYAAISRITLTQTAPGGFAEGAATFRHAATADPPPDPAIRTAASRAAEGVKDDSLRMALERLAENFLTRSKA